MTLFRAEVSRLKAENAAALSKLQQEKDAAIDALQEKDADMQRLTAEVTKMERLMEQLKASSAASAEEAVREEKREAEERSRETTLHMASGQTDLPPFLPPLHCLYIGRGQPCAHLAPSLVCPFLSTAMTLF